jgi:hypothetical protein
MNIFFDIDGVLTPKVGGVQITTQMDQQAIHDAIAYAKASTKGFDALIASMGILIMIYGWTDSADHLFFPTGRKKSEYEHETQELLFSGLLLAYMKNGNGPRKEYVEKARAESTYMMRNILWYPEELVHDQAVYYATKLDMIEGTLQNVSNIDDESRVALYFEDDINLISYIQAKQWDNNELIAKVECIHFEG